VTRALIVAGLLAFGVAGSAAGSLAWLWFRPGLSRALATGTLLSLLVVVPWSLMADLTIGTTGPLDLTGRDLPGSYARLAAGPTGNAAELAAVVITICAGCAVLAGWRTRRRPEPAAGPAALQLVQPPASPPAWPQVTVLRPAAARRGTPRDGRRGGRG
jgi:hypothetical protein